MRHIVLLLVVLLAPSVARAQDVLVLLDEGPLRTALAAELERRGIDATLAPAAPDPDVRAAESGAAQVVYLEGGRLHVGARRRPVSLGAISDPATLAEAAAALIEGNLTPLPRRYRVPAVGLYTGFEVFGYARFSWVTDGHVGVRSSLGLQLIDGFRIGAIYSLDGHSWSTPGVGSSWGLDFAAGVEAGWRFDFEVVAVHVGAHVLGGPGRRWADGQSSYVIQAGGYLGIGVWLGRRLELGFRATAEVWEQAGYATEPVIRGALRIEWR
jgi:hypothetical protein